MEIPDFVKTILRSAAPTLLTALGLPPPFSTIAASVVSNVLDKYLPPGQAPAGNPAQPKPTLSPGQVKEIVRDNAENPQFVLDLKKAEASLRQYELDAGIRFAELEIKDRQRAGDFQQATGLALRTFNAGITIVTVAIVGMFLMIAGALYVALGNFTFSPEKAQLTTAAFGLIGAAVGFINGIAATIVSFYYGSSQGSKEKSDIISAAVRNLGEGIERVAVREPTIIAAPAPVPSPTEPQPAPAPALEPAKPADASMIVGALDGLRKPHRLFPDSVTWSLTPGGVGVDGAAPQGTYGPPVTVRKIWQKYGEACASSARSYGVPVELIVATIAAESSGDPNARRAEPRIKDESVGLMQTLVKTARGALGRSTLKADDLLDPATSIAAGTAYIAQQRTQTHFDPPLVAAAYNAGSLRRDDGDRNRWRIHCYPAGTGQHIDRWVGWFNDCMEVSGKDGWSGGGTPSFAGALGGAGGLARPAAPALIGTGTTFPPAPDFLPLRDTVARQALFGAFDYVLDPQPDNREHIRITDGWDKREIVSVQVSAGDVAGRKGPFAFPFNRKAAPQLQALWAEWERAGLLSRILTFDGSFVPRLIRGSKASLSCHAFGAAFDINAAYNPRDKIPALVGKQGSVRELVAIANAHGFFWGGHFRTRLDGMHFEVARLL